MNKKIYYNQADSRWAKHPYPSKELPNATIKSGGCGATTSAMIISSLTDKTIRPDTLGDIFVKKGIRVNGGTDIAKASKYIADTYGIEYKKVNSDDDLINHLANGYVAIVSVYGESVFSTGGHIIFLCGYNNGQIQVHDPYLYTNKFNVYGRKGKVQLSGNDVWITNENWKAYAKSNLKYVFKIPENQVAGKYKIGQKVKAEFPIKLACDQGGIKVIVDSRGYQFWTERKIVADNNYQKFKALCIVEGYNAITKCYQMSVFKNTIYETLFDCVEEYLTDKF